MYSTYSIHIEGVRVIIVALKAIMLSLCIVVDLHVAFNNIKLLNVGPLKRKNELPLH
jgi:hypothetical protein